MARFNPPTYARFKAWPLFCVRWVREYLSWNFLDPDLQFGQIGGNNVPDQLHVEAKIVMNNPVAQSHYQIPGDIRIFSLKAGGSDGLPHR
jgi:hypothetical protein